MPAERNILYLDTTPDIPIAPIISGIAEHYGFTVDRHRYLNKENFEKTVQNAERPFDILYFASHGDPNGVRCNNEQRKGIGDFSWPELGLLFCQAKGLNDNSTILLASCDAGFKRGALTLMAACDKINIVAGLPCKMEVHNEPVIFNTFLHHHCQNSSGDQLANAVTQASGQEFRVYRRYEMDAEIGLFRATCPHLLLTDEELAIARAEEIAERADAAE